MLKFTFLGTCSGTEPMPERHHQSFVVEVGGLYYWFDAGESLHVGDRRHPRACRLHFIKDAPAVQQARLL